MMSPSSALFATRSAVLSFPPRRTTSVTTPTLPYHYPTINLVHWLHRDEQVLSVGVCQTAERDDYLAFGAVLADAVAVSDRRVAVPNSPHPGTRCLLPAEVN